MKVFILFFLSLPFILSGSIETLDLDVISYQDLQSKDPIALAQLRNALHDKGIVGVKGAPGYREKSAKFIKSARSFFASPKKVKQQYASDTVNFLGFGEGIEKFQRPNGEWVVDDLKVSFYALIPNVSANKWPREIDLETPLREIASLMSQTAKIVMKEIGMIGDDTNIGYDDVRHFTRTLHYKKSGKSHETNPYWCGFHYDHSMFTALLPAFYFVDGKQIPEPQEAGLFVREKGTDTFKKVEANDPDVMLFQVGEFGQLATDDRAQATEHVVRKAAGNVDRYTFVLFTEPTLNVTIHSNSVLTDDSRYSGAAGSPCTYAHWNSASFARYNAK
ncbi:MAG: 2-oxoglutarate and iron-dependent oxygenase domain-containing protein [Simkaniaceae bacterium]|nr:2-oxoglutarate and iron-dependent oxygenase domain-containing protein [Simkaniaceae bacterium]